MSSPVYIKIEGATQGLITSGASTEDSIGNRYQAGHEDEIMAQEIIHTVTVPTDTQSGQPSGQRVHKPFIFTCLPGSCALGINNEISVITASSKIVEK